MTRHIPYGIRNAGVTETVVALGERLGFTFQERESDYLGVHMLASVQSAEVKVVAQLDPEDEPLEDDFRTTARLYTWKHKATFLIWTARLCIRKTS